MKELVYEKKGAMAGMTVQEMIALVAGIGVIVLVFIFGGVLGGSAYQNTESDINSINNSTIKGYIQDAIGASFKGLKTTGNYIPIIALAVIISLILGLVLGITGAAGGEAVAPEKGATVL